MTQNEIKERIEYGFIGKHSAAKKTAVAKAVSKFVNKYMTLQYGGNVWNIDICGAIDGCMQYYSTETDLAEYLDLPMVMTTDDNLGDYSVNVKTKTEMWNEIEKYITQKYELVTE